MEEHQEQSKFNAGIDKLQFIGQLKREIHEYRKLKDYDSWKDCLGSFRMELDEKMKKEQREICDHYEKRINYLLLSTSQNLQDPMMLYNLLQNYQMELGRIAGTLGWGMPSLDDPRFALS